jgi:hypothetical protein
MVTYTGTGIVMQLHCSGQCCESETIFLDPDSDPIFVRVLDPDPDPL